MNPRKIGNSVEILYDARQAVLEACILCAPQVRENIRLIAELGLTLDLWSHHNHLPQVIETVRECPQCAFILDHIGGPLRSRGHWKDERDATDAQWRADITALAELPNVFMKVGGTGMASMGIPSVEESWPRAAAPPSSQAMSDAVFPFYEHVIQSFGTDRCMLESIFPVDKCSFSSTTSRASLYEVANSRITVEYKSTWS